MLDRRLVQNFDWFLFLIIVLLAFISITNMYSATHALGKTGLKIFKRHICWYGLSFFVFFFVLLFDYKSLNKWAYHIYLLSIFLLVLVLVWGKISSGSQRWFKIGFISFQPSELAKISVAILISHILSEMPQKKGYTLRELWKIFLFTGIPFLLILKEPDLGTALIILIFSGTTTLLAGVRKGSILIFVLTAVVLTPIVWTHLKDYQKKRILTFINPNLDPLGAGYHITQSKIAIGSGMLFGKGFLKGSQSRLRFLPEQHTDFIFSVFAEERGFVGCVALIFLYCCLILRGLDIAKNSKDKFGVYLAVSISMLMFWQIFINIGMVAGILPVVGTPLLFMSYGGSSLIFTMASVGILMNIRMRRYMFNGI